MYQRTIAPHIINHRGKGKVIIIYGARQVGKTTLCNYLIKDKPHVLSVTGDDPDLVGFLEGAGLATLGDRCKAYDTILIDEAQKIRNIGTILKLLVDTYNDKQFIATGSSSFELANSISEPLTGRTVTFHLHPLSLWEWGNDIPLHQRQNMLEKRIIMGMYPTTIIDDSVRYLNELSQSYVYKDIFSHEFLKKPDLIVKLLQALALQIGSEVSVNELSRLLGADNKTIQRYITLLEQAFIIFHLPSLSRNHRNEIKKGKKVYFWDLGVRNSLIRNTNPIALRNDIGGMRENFVISERIKHMSNTNTEQTALSYFWRTRTQQEIDYIEDRQGQLTPYEIKRSSHKKSSLPSSFSSQYTTNPLAIVNPQTIRAYTGW